MISVLKIQGVFSENKEGHWFKTERLKNLSIKQLNY